MGMHRHCMFSVDKGTLNKGSISYLPRTAPSLKRGKVFRLNTHPKKFENKIRIPVSVGFNNPNISQLKKKRDQSLSLIHI